MGRALLNAPLHVLSEQIFELSHWVQLDDFVQATSIDAFALAYELEEHYRVGLMASAHLGVAHDQQGLLPPRRAQWRARYVEWARVVRTMLKVPRPGADAAQAEVRRALGKYAGRTFAGSRDRLVLTLEAMRTHADTLQLEAWLPDPRPHGEELLEAASALAEEGQRAKRLVRQRSEEAAAARRRAQDLIRQVRLAWEMARLTKPALLELPLNVLEAYEPPTRRPRRQAAPEAPDERPAAPEPVDEAPEIVLADRCAPDPVVPTSLVELPLAEGQPPGS